MAGYFTNFLQCFIFVSEAHLDIREILKAGASLGALFLDKDTPIILSIKDGEVRLSVRDGVGEARIEAQAKPKRKKKAKAQDPPEATRPQEAQEIREPLTAGA